MQSISPVRGPAMSASPDCVRTSGRKRKRKVSGREWEVSSPSSMCLVISMVISWNNTVCQNLRTPDRAYSLSLNYANKILGKFLPAWCCVAYTSHWQYLCVSISSHLPVFAEVQTPQACLISSHLVFSEIYIGVPAQANIRLFNQILLPAKYCWGEVSSFLVWGIMLTGCNKGRGCKYYHNTNNTNDEWTEMHCRTCVLWPLWLGQQQRVNLGTLCTKPPEIRATVIWY